MSLPNLCSMCAQWQWTHNTSSLWPMSLKPCKAWVRSVLSMHMVLTMSSSLSKQLLDVLQAQGLHIKTMVTPLLEPGP